MDRLQFKKFYYRLLDFNRVTQYLKDVHYVILTQQAISMLKQIAAQNIWPVNDEEIRTILPSSLVALFDEYQELGTVAFIDQYLTKIPDWFRILILPDYLNLHFLRQVIDNNHIEDKETLISFFNSIKAVEMLGKDLAELYAYYVEYLDSDSFPYKYSHKPTSSAHYVAGEKIRGNFHNHSIFSDGKCDLHELVEMAKKSEREYIGISDHSKSANGIHVEMLHQQIHQIDTLNSDFKILKGIECEILENGSLDFEKEILDSLDYVIIAVHGSHILTKKNATNMLIKAIENPRSCILAHPSSKIHRKNIGLFVDMKKIIQACVRNNVFIELNGDPSRLDLDPMYIKYALKANAKFTIDSDTHTKIGFHNIQNAIEIAEDMIIPPENILNTYDIQNVIKSFHFKK